MRAPSVYRLLLLVAIALAFPTSIAQGNDPLGCLIQQSADRSEDSYLLSLLSPSDGQTVVAGTPVTFTVGSLQPPTLALASSQTSLSSPNIDSGTGTLQPSGAYTFTSKPGTANPGTVYWAANYWTQVHALDSAGNCVSTPTRVTAATRTFNVLPATGPGIAISATVAPQVLSSLGGHSFTVSVRITNSGPATDVFLSLAGRPWPHAGTTRGRPLDFGTPTVDAPATLKPIPPPPIPPPVPWSYCVRGQDYNYGQADVVMPARSATTLAMPVTAVLPSWKGTDYTPTLNWETPTGTPVPIAVPAVTMQGPTGVRIQIVTKPQGAQQHAIISGARVTISGSTDPRVRSAVVRVSARYFPTAYGKTPKTTLLGLVRTNAAGQFVIRGWRPRATGAYQLLSSITNVDSQLQPDSTCAPTVWIQPK